EISLVEGGGVALRVGQQLVGRAHRISKIVFVNLFYEEYLGRFGRVGPDATPALRLLTTLRSHRAIRSYRLTELAKRKSLVLRPMRSGSSSHGRCPTELGRRTSSASDIRLTVRCATAAPPNGSSSPHRKSVGVDTARSADSGIVSPGAGPRRVI